MPKNSRHYNLEKLMIIFPLSLQHFLHSHRLRCNLFDHSRMDDWSVDQLLHGLLQSNHSRQNRIYRLILNRSPHQFPKLITSEILRDCQHTYHGSITNISILICTPYFSSNGSISIINQCYRDMI